ncbi:Non-specific serine/threonine protein kinase [Bertholletia excelsa]
MVFTLEGCSSFNVFYILVFLYSLFVTVGAGNTMEVGELKRDGEYLESSNKLFQLSFFSSSNLSNRYLGVQHMICTHDEGDKLPCSIWIVNRNNPIPNSSGFLNITQEGNLVLSASEWTPLTIYAQQPASTSNSTVWTATLLDTGNFVLRAGKRVVWQSFDYPTDSWLPGMKLGLVKSSKGKIESHSLTSFSGSRNPSVGAFRLGVDPNNTKQLVLWRRGRVYWRSRMWNGTNGDMFGKNYPHLFNFSYFSNEGESYFTYTGQEGMSPSFIFADANGQVSMYNETDYSTTIVECPGDGCVASETFDCWGSIFFQAHRRLDGGIDLKNRSLSFEDCENICRSNCSCNAFAYSLPDGPGCKITDSYGYSDKAASLVWYRAPASTPNPTPALAPHDALGNNSTAKIGNVPHNSGKKHGRLAVGIGSGVGFFIVLTLIFLLCYLPKNYGLFKGNNENDKNITISLANDLKRKIAKFDMINSAKEDRDLPLFTLPTIKIATNHFSEVYKLGQGGFGPVYKGMLVNGQEIAVKRLSKRSQQGLEEFKNEVILISKLQHRNLVRLLGCCIQAGERILIYEYMHNKSLDFFLFDDERRVILNWKMRVCIIEGIAQGLLYLHKYSRLKIIHRDLKISNILLDDDMNPKISDFGTARIFGDNESRANTNRIVGTYGYMSPEYAMDGLFSVKSDIFSFGVMILEIISGKKNSGFYHPDHALNLLGYAWKLWKEGKVLEIMDQTLVGTCPPSEVMKYVHIGFLCVQDSATDRPTISETVAMFNSKTIHMNTPKQPAFAATIGLTDLNKDEISKCCSINDVTVTELEVR